MLRVDICVICVPTANVEWAFDIHLISNEFCDVALDDKMSLNLEIALLVLSKTMQFPLEDKRFFSYLS